MRRFSLECAAAPEHGAQVCDVWCERDPDKTAIIDATDLGNIKHYTYADLSRAADTLAHHLKGLGIVSGDRIGVLRSQDLWTAAAHIAIWKLGAISIPLFKLFGPEALSSRLLDAGAKCVIVDHEGHSGVECTERDAGPARGVDVIRSTIHLYKHNLGNTRRFDLYLWHHGKIQRCASRTSRFDGSRAWVEVSHDFLGQNGDVIWTPADWAWIGGLFDVLMPALALGVPVVAARLAKFTPVAAKEIIETLGVKNVFFPPTALRMIKAADLTSQACARSPAGANRWVQKCCNGRVMRWA